MSRLKRERGKGKVGMAVGREDNAVRFSARSTWISLKMRLSILGGSSVSILISFLVRAGLSRKSSRATSQPRHFRDRCIVRPQLNAQFHRGGTHDSIRQL